MVSLLSLGHSPACLHATIKACVKPKTRASFSVNDMSSFSNDAKHFIAAQNAEINQQIALSVAKAYQNGWAGLRREPGHFYLP
jgi:hypothetical protein